MNVLMVLTSHDQLGDTGEKTGFWLEEFAAPYYELADAGATITLASTRRRPAAAGPPQRRPRGADRRHEAVP
jgi:putative intracellular protease/amidase